MKKIISFILIITTLVLATGCTSSKPGDTTFLNFNWGMSIEDVQKSIPKDFKTDREPYTSENDSSSYTIPYDITDNKDTVFSTMNIDGVKKTNADFSFKDNKLDSIIFTYEPITGSEELVKTINEYLSEEYGEPAEKNIYDDASWYDYFKGDSKVTLSVQYGADYILIYLKPNS